MIEGITQLEGWWVGPVLLALWVAVGVLVYVLQRMRRERRDRQERQAPRPEDRLAGTLEAHRRAEEEERGERDQP